MNLVQQAAVYGALGDETRLRIVESLWLNDQSPLALRQMLDIDSNLLAHHLDVLEEAGVVERQVSAGDRRRRYVTARLDVLDGLFKPPRFDAGSVLFICTHNSARSQVAEAFVRQRTGLAVQSAGTQPAQRVHPKAITAGRELGVDLTQSRPKPYEAIEHQPDLVVSVCDRAWESELPFPTSRIHWSIPDPVEESRIDDFRNAFSKISIRVDRLVETIERGSQ